MAGNFRKKFYFLKIKFTVDETYLERHLICSKGSIEIAKKRLDKLCTLRGLMPEYLQGFDIENEFNNHLIVSQTCILPKPTPDNCRILFTNFHNPITSMYDSKYMARYLLLMVEYLRNHDYNAGLELICNSANLTLGIISKINPIIVSNTFMIISEAIGFRVKAIHFLSGSKLLDTLLAIMKQSLSKKLASRLHVHENSEEMFKFISKAVIPEDLGGGLPVTLKEICENNRKEFSSPEFMEKMKNLENATTDESKRLSSKFNEEYSGMPGSFKILSVD